MDITISLVAMAITKPLFTLVTAVAATIVVVHFDRSAVNFQPKREDTVVFFFFFLGGGGGVNFPPTFLVIGTIPRKLQKFVFACWYPVFSVPSLNQFVDTIFIDNVNYPSLCHLQILLQITLNSDQPINRSINQEGEIS